MQTTLKITLSGIALSILSACGGGSFDDQFFQADSTLKGVVCIDGLYAATNSNEAQDIVDRLFTFYGSTGNVSTVTSARGFGANCADYRTKATANIIITEDFYTATIVPATNKK